MTGQEFALQLHLSIHFHSPTLLCRVDKADTYDTPQGKEREREIDRERGKTYDEPPQHGEDPLLSVLRICDLREQIRMLAPVGYITYTETKKKKNASVATSNPIASRKESPGTKIVGLGSPFTWKLG